MARWKTSVGIWAFGPAGTRFVPGGYHPEQVGRPPEELVKYAVDGLGDLMDGYEFHYSTEITEQNLPKIQAALGPDHDIYCICYGMVPNPRYKLGSLINPDPVKRAEAVAHMKAGIDMAAEVGAHYIYWPGNEGYNYPMQRDYATTWAHFIEGIQAAVEHANSKNVTFLLEHKNSEPAMAILMRNIGMKLHIIHKLRELGTDVSRVKVNMDWQHLIMNGEPLGEYAGMLLAEGLLGHQHANSGWGSFDDDNMVGTQFIEQQIDLARELVKGNYQGRIGFDLYPYTEDAVEAVRRSVIHWEYILEVAKRTLADPTMAQAQAGADSIGAYRSMWKALGLNAEFEKAVEAKYRKG